MRLSSSFVASSPPSTSTTMLLPTLRSNVRGSRSLHSSHGNTQRRAPSSPVITFARSKALIILHFRLPRPVPVLPKPSHIASTLPSEDVRLPPAHPQPPPHQGPPRLIRYEVDGHQHQQHSSSTLYPVSYSHASYPDAASYRAHLSNRRAPASLFGLFPSTSATAASLQSSSDPYAYSSPTGSAIQTSVPTPTLAPSSSEEGVTLSSSSETSTTMAATTSSIVDAAKSGQSELQQRKKGVSSAPAEAAPKTNAVLGHSHSHAGHHHGHDHGSAEEADKLLAALKGKVTEVPTLLSPASSPISGSAVLKVLPVYTSTRPLCWQMQHTRCRTCLPIWSRCSAGRCRRSHPRLRTR